MNVYSNAVSTQQLPMQRVVLHVREKTGETCCGRAASTARPNSWSLL